MRSGPFVALTCVCFFPRVLLMASTVGAPNGNGNANKSMEKLFLPYDWATKHKPAASTVEELSEMRQQRLKLRGCLRHLKEQDNRKEYGA